MEARLSIYRGHYFFFYAAMSAVTTFVALYFRDAMSFNNVQIGLITSTYAVTSIFCQPLWGMAADLTRKPKAIAIALMAVSVGMALMLLHKGPFILTFAVYFLYSFFAGGLMPLFDSITMNYLAKKPDIGFGQIRYLGSIGYGISALVVGYVIDATSLDSIFIAFAVLVGISLIFTSRMENGSRPDRGSFKEDFKALLKVREYWLITLFLFLLLGFIYGAGAYLGLFLLEKGYSAKTVGLIFFLMAGLEMPFMIFSRRIVSRFGFNKIIFLLAILSSIRMFAMSLDIGIAGFLAVSATVSAVIGLILPSVLEQVSAIVPKGVFSTSVSIYIAASFGLGVWIMTLLGGVMADAFGYALLFRYYSYFSLTAVLMAIWIIKKGTSSR